MWSPGGGYIGVFCKRFSACGFPLSPGSWLGSSRARCFSCMHVFRDIAPSPEANWLLLVSPFCRFRRMKKLHFLEVPSCVYSGVASIAVHFLVFYEYIFIFLGTFLRECAKRASIRHFKNFEQTLQHVDVDVFSQFNLFW